MKLSTLVSVFVVSAGLAPPAQAQAGEGLGDECEQWNSLSVGVNLFASSLLVFDGDLIVGGAFTHAGGQLVNRIARWDGSTWHPIGSGMNQDINALTVYDGDLVAGGWFTTAGGTSASRIARWASLPSATGRGTDEVAWLPLGSGVAAGPNVTHVAALAVFNGQLIAGGQFLIAGGVSANFIAQWNGVSWQPLASGTNGDVNALTAHNGELILGGSFTVAGGHAALRIARWNGSSWLPLGGGMNAQVHALTTYNGNLIAGGTFTTAGGVQVNSIARWNLLSQSWEPLGGGMSGGNPTSVHALAVYNGDLIAGGAFTHASGIPANGIARWNDDTQQWLPLANSFNVNAITLFNDELIAAGGFNPTGPNFIAGWKDCTASSCSGDLDGNGVVDEKDLILILMRRTWGPCVGNCPADLNGDGAVGVPDLLSLLSQWGPCPQHETFLGREEKPSAGPDLTPDAEAVRQILKHFPLIYSEYPK